MYITEPGQVDSHITFFISRMLVESTCFHVLFIVTRLLFDFIVYSSQSFIIRLKIEIAHILVIARWELIMSTCNVQNAMGLTGESIE